MALNISFKDKKILITGGGRGVGRALVKRFYDDGAEIFTLEKDENLVNELKNDFPKAHVHKCDISDWECTRKIIETFGPLDHLVNNAAIGVIENFLEIKEESMKSVFGVNFFGVVNVSQIVAKGMIDGGKTDATIVNISSVTSRYAMHGLTSYASSKAAINMLTRNMAVELGEHGIRVNCICPSGIDTEMLKAIKTIQHKTPIAARLIIKKAIDPNEIVDLVSYLLSPNSGMITGQDIFIDGGTNTN